MGCGGLYDGQMLNCCFIPWLSYKSFGAAVNKLFRHTSLLLASYLKVTLMGVLLYQILTSNISSINMFTLHTFSEGGFNGKFRVCQTLN